MTAGEKKKKKIQIKHLKFLTMGAESIRFSIIVNIFIIIVKGAIDCRKKYTQHIRLVNSVR